MRQAVTTIIAVLSLAFSPVARASFDGTDAAATIAQARRLIDAKDYSPASNLLEDLLPDATTVNRPVILDLLRQSYEAMAREAKAAGRDREAAHFLDNLAIISHVPGKAAPTKPIAEKPSKSASQGSPTASTTSPAAPGPALSPAPSRNVALVGSAQPQTPTPAPPPKPAPLAEPPKATMPEPVPFVPKEIGSPDSAGASVQGDPMPPLRTNGDPGRDPGDTPGAAPGSVGVVGSNTPVSVSAPEAPARADDSKPATDGPTLEAGDRLFAASKYIDAGQVYAALARQNRLPAHRKQHWAYCRMVEVARRINLRPKSPREWDEIEAEIVSIQRMSPNIWYAEYLRSKVAEVRRGGRRPQAKSDALVVRGTSPDENQDQPDPPSRRFPRLFGNSRGAAAANAQPAAPTPAASPEVLLNLPGDSSPSRAPSAPGPAPDHGQSNERDAAVPGLTAPSPAAPDAEAAGAGDDSSSSPWQVYETINFRVYHRNARLAETAGQAAEAVRAAQAKRWASPAAQRPWTPACEVYLYPSGKVFARETKQPEDSPGFSTMECNGSRVVARRVNLRADHPQMVAAILPHEVTHVVLADLFTNQQIPRWADEGMAVLAEPRAEQQVRAAELQEPLESGRVFDLSKLMAMDYPDAKDWSLYYAQSVSLTRFLVEQAPPEQFIQFVRTSQRDGIESALRGTYRIAGLAELQTRWTEYARQRLGPIREASRDPRSQPADAEVK